MTIWFTSPFTTYLFPESIGNRSQQIDVSRLTQYILYKHWRFVNSELEVIAQLPPSAAIIDLAKLNFIFSPSHESHQELRDQLDFFPL